MVKLKNKQQALAWTSFRHRVLLAPRSPERAFPPVGASPARCSGSRSATIFSWPLAVVARIPGRVQCLKSKVSLHGRDEYDFRETKRVTLLLSSAGARLRFGLCAAVGLPWPSWHADAVGSCPVPSPRAAVAPGAPLVRCRDRPSLGATAWEACRAAPVHSPFVFLQWGVPSQPPTPLERCRGPCGRFTPPCAGGKERPGESSAAAEWGRQGPARGGGAVEGHSGVGIGTAVRRPGRSRP